MECVVENDVHVIVRRKFDAYYRKSKFRPFREAKMCLERELFGLLVSHLFGGERTSTQYEHCNIVHQIYRTF